MTESPSTQERKGSLTLRALVAPIVLIVSICVVWQAWVRPTLVTTAPSISLPSEPLPLSEAHLKGSPDARIGLVVFSDFECPACARFAREVLPAVIEQYVETDRVLLAFSDLPLEALHAGALRRAAIAECAGRQEQFWAVHDALFARPNDPNVERESTKTLDQKRLTECLASEGYDAVRARQTRARSLRLSSTPTLFVGQVTNGRLHVSDALTGFRSFQELSVLLDQRLEERPSAKDR